MYVIYVRYICTLYVRYMYVICTLYVHHIYMYVICTLDCIKMDGTVPSTLKQRYRDLVKSLAIYFK